MENILWGWVKEHLWNLISMLLAGGVGTWGLLKTKSAKQKDKAEADIAVQEARRKDAEADDLIVERKNKEIERLGNLIIDHRKNEAVFHVKEGEYIRNIETLKVEKHQLELEISKKDALITELGNQLEISKKAHIEHIKQIEGLQEKITILEQKCKTGLYET